MLHAVKKISKWTMIAIATVMITATDAIARPLQEIEQIAQASTVLIDGLNPGSGVIVARDRDHYWVLTAQHVIATEDEYWVIAPDGTEYPLQYGNRKLFPGQDLALIPFRSRRSYEIATLADYPQLDGSFPTVFVSGWQGSNIHQQPLQHRLTGGQLLPRRYGLIHAQAPLARGYRLFYTTTTEQGMSGGPILNTEGQVIGIHGRSEGEEISAETGMTRLHWGFSSGLPLPDNLTSQVSFPVKWSYQTQPPPPPSPGDINSYRDLLTLSQGQPTNTVDWINLGNQLYRQEQFEQALVAFETALNQEADLYQAWYGRAQVLNALGDYRHALSAYNQVLQLEPEFVQALRDRALVWILAGQPQQAVADFDAVVQATPQDYVAWYLRGNLFWKYQGWNEAALGSYDRALSIMPDFAEVWIERGRVLNEMGRGQDAISSLQTATRLEPDLMDGWYWLAIILHTQQQPTAALAALEKVLTIAPNDLKYLLLEAQIWVQLQQPDTARQRLLNILQIASVESPEANTANLLLQEL